MGTFASFFSLLSIANWIIKILSAHLRNSKNRLPLPPGPKPMPLIGNMLDFPMVNMPQVYAEWGKKYNSPLLHIEALGNHVVIVNSFEDADQLFERTERARIYADRPHLPVFPLIDWDYNLAMLPYGDWWRRNRKVCQQYFNIQTTGNYEDIQTKKMYRLLQGLLETPKDFDVHNKLLSFGLTAAMMYGYDLKSIEDPLVTIADETVVIVAKLMAPGGSLINIIPALQYVPSWFPGASSAKLIAHVKMLTAKVMKIPIDFVKKSFEEGTVTSSLVSDFYEKKFNVGATSEEEEIVTNVAYSIYGAASDTTISATGTFFYTMAIHPKVQRRAYAEIDRVVGRKRLPSFQDREALPYVEAIYREVMRFNPPLPLSVPHSVTQDDIYKGYLIPKGKSVVTSFSNRSTVIPNIWAMTHNEEIYPDPFTFKPERFLDQDGKLKGPNRILAYGFGRRICAGRHVAETTMWLMMVSVLSCFEIAQAKDEHGNLIEINGAYDNSGLVSLKEKFEWDFRVREGARNLILESL